MSELKKGDVVELNAGFTQHFYRGDKLNFVRREDDLSVLSMDVKFHNGNFTKINDSKLDYANSNRYKLHKAASATGFSFSKLSRAMGRSDTYISNESKESRFNSRGDLTDKRYNQLIIDLAYAERTLNGNPAKVVDIETELPCTEKPLELEPKENYEHAAKCFEDTFNRSIADHKEDLFMIESDGVKPIFTPKQKIKSKTEVNKSIVWFILFILVVVVLVLVAGIYKSIF